MTRNLHADVVTEIDGDAVAPILFFEANFDSGALRFWTGLGEFPGGWDGKTWLGAGDVIKVSDIEETAEMRAAGAVFSVSGIPSALLSIALAEPYQGRSAKCWLAFLTDAGTLIGDPYLLFDGRMDVMEIEEGGQTATIKISAESKLIALQRAKNRFCTDQDQRADYPDDTFFSGVAELQDLEIVLEG